MRSDNYSISGSLFTAEDILGRANAAVPLLREKAVETEESRHLPVEVVEILRETGVFRMAMSRGWGGPEMDSRQQTRVIEVLATGDASAAWCAMIGADSAIYSGYLRESVAHDVFPLLDMITAGWIPPEGRAERVLAGYRITGRWHLGSGCRHCDWLVAGCAVYCDGVLEPMTDGKPVKWRVMLARPEQYETSDTWFTTGLADSGSCDYMATDLFIPAQHSFSFFDPHREGPLYRAPDALLRKKAGVPLGVAQAAIDHVRGRAAYRIERRSNIAWSSSYRVQVAVAEAEMELAAARHSVCSSLERHGSVWWLRSAHCGGTSRGGASALRCFRAARMIVSRLYDVVGGSVSYKKSSPNGPVAPRPYYDESTRRSVRVNAAGFGGIASERTVAASVDLNAPVNLAAISLQYPRVLPRNGFRWK